MAQLLKIVLLLSLLVGTLGITPTFAEEPAVGSKDDNACNPGGVMDGKCDTEWAWVCGWYLARLTSNVFSRTQVPAMCASVLPSLPVAVAESADCLLVADTVVIDLTAGVVTPVVNLFSNDCQPVPLIAAVFASNVNSVVSVSGLTGLVQAGCWAAGPWSQNFSYTDQTGRRARVTLSGNCL